MSTLTSKLKAYIAKMKRGTASTPAEAADELATVEEAMRSLESAEAIGKILSEEEMDIGYDRRVGNVLWWNKPAGPALLYAAPAPVVAPAWEDCRRCGAAILTTHPGADSAVAPAPEARAIAEWHDDHGNVLWWAFPINEPPWVGQPDDSDWPGYHTHWTPLPPLPNVPPMNSIRHD